MLQILEKALKILFDTKDISLVKLYITKQFDKIFRRQVSIQDLTFAKEFRGMRGYKPNACVPALELTRRLIKKDPRAIPRTSERVRYIIVAGAPNQALIHCVRTPMEVITDSALVPNSVYYITKVIIPPLNRCFNLFGIDINTWYVLYKFVKPLSFLFSFFFFFLLSLLYTRACVCAYICSIVLTIFYDTIFLQVQRNASSLEFRYYSAYRREQSKIYHTAILQFCFVSYLWGTSE